ncbi:Methylase of chemotaxis methyl-accepting proteins [Duganella sp. CF458]|uniref:CheR family methyltransferase n=1 Tax=Duganella sp. CF458 TaxID=1884368 RepID=UPI0008EF2367|nr:CheR family methyltransferase [Duganella sp. CF458]SFF86269.1 Methylase of chemotaxis methyl-accepting proteins [Duganella sp. CF458]
MNSPNTLKAELGMASVKFPLVGIGASAGGLAALERLLPGLPAQPGFSIVVIMHLLPDHPSQCAEMLQRFSKMPVSQVTQHPTEVLVNHIYVIAPGTLLKMEDRYLFIEEAHAGHTTLGAIDYFFHSLALSHRQLAFGVLLSGMGHDGCGGLAALREQGGTAIVQLPQDAQFATLPEAAVKGGQADIILPAHEIAARLVMLCSGSPAGALVGDGTEAESEAQALPDVLAMVHEHTGHDFSHYKRPTILRRLERRLHLHGVHNVAAYRTLMANDGEEAGKLMKDLLIGVTGFFRDRLAFEQLRETLQPAMREACAKGEFRAWVAACSTGQEAYSLAMLLADAARGMSDPPRIHIFASDIDEQALGVARAGLYPASIQDEVPQDSLERYFARSGKQYRVRQALRELITFASHNLLRDPPFSSLDLVSCRNLMIYLDRAMQRHVLHRFHFSLDRGGLLFLGNAETAASVPELFSQLDRTHRIFLARVIKGRQPDMEPDGAGQPSPHFQRRASFGHVPAGAGAAQPRHLSLDELRDRLAIAESGCEALQSHNEELSTVNAELKARLDDTGRANDDLANLIASVDLATIFVGPGLTVKRFTPRAAGIFNLIPRDVGRSLLDITHRLDYPQLKDDVAATFDSLQPLEREVAASDGRHYIVRVRPYRTGEDVIAGAVLTFFDISQRRAVEDEKRAMAGDQEFLLDLGDCLRPLADPMQVLLLGCRMAGERLAVPQLAFARIQAGRYAVLPGHAAGVPALHGEGEVETLGAQALACWRAGEAAVEADLARAAGTGRLAELAGGRGTLLGAVCRKGEQWLGFFLACQAAARNWSATEIALFAEAVARIGVEFERARSQAALRASEGRLRELLRGIAKVSWEADAGGEGAKAWLDAIHPDDRARAQAMWREAVRSCGSRDADVRVEDRGGGWSRASVLATPLLDEQGNVRKWSGCIIDVDERVAAPSGSI